MDNYYDWIATFSGRGYAMKDHGVLAPALFVYSTVPGNGYAFMSGTSMAAPHVAGLIALMKQRNPRLTPSNIADIIFESADDVYNGFYAVDDKQWEQGYGKINVTAALDKI
jgi:subtilisin family serine protease